MKLIYVAGPYRAKTEWGLIQNIRNAEAVALEIWKMGMVAYCPHKNTAHFGGACQDKVWLDGGLEVLRRCDGLVMIKGWSGSEGAIAEENEAGKFSIPIFYSIRDFKQNYRRLWTREQVD